MGRLGRRFLATAAATVLWVSAARASAADANATQKLDLYAKPAVVRVVTTFAVKLRLGNSDLGPQGITSTGSGFFLSADGYIATNTHVVAIAINPDNGLADLRRIYAADLASKLPDPAHAPSVAQIAAALQPVGEVKVTSYVVLQDGTHLDYDVKEHGSVAGEGDGKDCAIIKVQTSNAPTLTLGDSSKVREGDTIEVMGYPSASDMGDFVADEGQLRPTISPGQVSRIILSKSGSQLIQVTAPTTHGNSGGPAINQDGEVIGLLTFGNQETQGFNVLVSSSTLAEFVRKAGVGDMTSPTSVAWHTAVDLFFDARYSAAIDQLQEINALFPHHAAAKELLQLAYEAKGAGKERTSTAVLAGGGAASLVVVMLPVIMLRRRKKRGSTQANVSGNWSSSASSPTGGGSVAPGPGASGVRPAPAAAVSSGSFTSSPAPAPTPAPLGGTVFAGGRHGLLTATSGSLRGQRFTLTTGGLLIGRQPGVAHVIVNDGRASGQHCWVKWEGERLFAIDQSTTNGTFINDANAGRISRAELKNGDVLIIADPECCSLAVSLS